MTIENNRFVIGDKLTIEDQKREMVCILEHMANFCDNHKIRYYLAWGTLLGAVREHGMIPWDYDIDVVMPRSDYDKFIKLYSINNPIKKYELLARESNQDYFGRMARIRNVETMAFTDVQLNEYDIGKSIQIEIFPIDGMTNNKLIQIIYACKMQLLKNICNLKIREQKGMLPEKKYKRLTFKILNLLTITFTVKKTLDLIDKNRRKYDLQKEPLISCAPNNSVKFSLAIMVNKKILDNPVKVMYEGKEYPVFRKFDPFLKRLYGDYMTKPNELEIKRAISIRDSFQYVYRKFEVEN